MFIAARLHRGFLLHGLQRGLLTSVAFVLGAHAQTLTAQECQLVTVGPVADGSPQTVSTRVTISTTRSLCVEQIQGGLSWGSFQDEHLIPAVATQALICNGLLVSSSLVGQTNVTQFLFNASTSQVNNSVAGTTYSVTA